MRIVRCAMTWVAIAACLAACGAKSSSTPSGPHPTDPIYRNAFPPSVVLGATYSVAFGTPQTGGLPLVKVTLKTLTDPVTSFTGTPPATGSRYVAAELVMVNADAKLSASYNLYKMASLNLGGPNGAKPVSGVALTGLTVFPDSTSSLAAGQTTDGWLVFSIPKTAIPSRFLLNNSAWVVLPAAPSPS